MQMKCCKNIAELFDRLFQQYGRLIGRNPWRVIALIVFVSCGLGMALFWTTRTDDLSSGFVLIGSQAETERDKLEDMGYRLNYNKKPYDTRTEIEVIVTRPSGWNFASFLQAINLLSNGYFSSSSPYTTIFPHIKDRIVNSSCVSNLTFPTFLDGNGKLIYYGDVVEKSVKTARDLCAYQGSIKLRFYTEYGLTSSGFSTRLSSLEQNIRYYISSDYSYTYTSIDVPYFQDTIMDKDYNDAVLYYIGMFVLFITVSFGMSYSSNNIGQYSMLVIAQVACTVMVLTSSIMVVNICGLDVNIFITGYVVFTIFVMGLLRIFIQVSNVAGQSYLLSTEAKIGNMMSSTGQAITLSFVFEFCVAIIWIGWIGPGPYPYQNVGLRIFGTFYGISLLTSYITQMTFIPACLSLNNSRSQLGLHWFSCFPIIQQTNRTEKNLSNQTNWCCKGSVPTARQDVNSYCDTCLKYIIRIIVKSTAGQIMTVVLFALYLFVCIGLSTIVIQDDKIDKLGSPGTKLNTFFKWNKQFEDITYITFIITEPDNFDKNYTQGLIRKLLDDAKADPHMRDDFEVFVDKRWNSYNYGPYSYMYAIYKSRYLLLSRHLPSAKAKADLMRRMRTIASDSELPVIAFSKDFMQYEQYATLLPDFLLSLTIPLLIIVFLLGVCHVVDVTCIIYILLSSVSFVTCMFGWLGLTGVAVNFISMLPFRTLVTMSLTLTITMCVEYSKTQLSNQRDRVFRTVENVCVPIAKTYLCCLVGLLCICNSSSYVLFTIFSLTMICAVNSIIHFSLLFPCVLMLSDRLFGRSSCPVIVSNKVHIQVDENIEMSKIQY